MAPEGDEGRNLRRTSRKEMAGNNGRECLVGAIEATRTPHIVPYLERPVCQLSTGPWIAVDGANPWEWSNGKLWKYRGR